MQTNPQFQQWLDTYGRLRARVERLTTSIHDRGWRLAATADIPRDMCCLHNASIDEGLKGWCKDSPDRLRVAKQACRILHDWSAHRLLECLAAKAWNRLLGGQGYALRPVPPAPSINPHLLFHVS